MVFNILIICLVAWIVFGVLKIAAGTLFWAIAAVIVIGLVGELIRSHHERKNNGNL